MYYIHVLARVYMHVLVHNRKICLRGWATQLKPYIEQGKDQSMLAQSPYSVTLVIVLYVIINHYQLQMTIQALILLSA